MKKPNIKLLTSEERKFFNDYYSIELSDSFVLIKTKNFDRTTVHPKDEDFSLSNSVRKMKISKEAIKLWEENFKDSYSLIDVQNAMNALYLAYQSLEKEDVEKQLKIINQLS